MVHLAIAQHTTFSTCIHVAAPEAHMDFSDALVVIKVVLGSVVYGLLAEIMGLSGVLVRCRKMLCANAVRSSKFAQLDV